MSNETDWRGGGEGSGVGKVGAEREEEVEEEEGEGEEGEEEEDFPLANGDAGLIGGVDLEGIFGVLVLVGVGGECES